jgi:hypothetical protein
MNKTTEALKLAEEALESCDAGDYSTGHVIHPSFNNKTVDEALAAIREALAEPVKQEPEYWEVHNGVCPHGVYRTEEQAEQVRFDMQKSHDLSGSLASFNVRPLYAAPVSAKREWVNLTEDEQLALAKKSEGKSRHWLVCLVSEILMEKNK